MATPIPAKYVAPIGRYGKGNIDLNDRPQVKNSDGSISTVYSMTFNNDDGSAVLVPGVRKGLDRQMTPNEALAHYKKSGEYLGKFKSEAAANAYAEALHKSEAAKLVAKPNQDGAAITVKNVIKPK